MVTRRASRPEGALGWLGAGSGDPWTDGLLLAGAAGAGALTVGALVWVAGSCLSLLTGAGPGPGPAEAARRLTGPGGLDAVWPGLPTPLVVATAAVLAAAVTIAVVCAGTRWRDAHPAREGLAHPRQLRVLLPGTSGAAVARRLRPTLPVAGRVADADRGVPLGVLAPSLHATGQRRGRHPGRVARATWEDVLLAICAPRSGKTTCLAVPAVLDAPGPVLATSNKADLWQLTARPREHATGQQVWTFDPQHITGTPQAFVWDALDGVSTVADARRLAGHFVQEIRRTADHGDFWDRDAEDLLTGLLLAAALTGGTLAQVGTWLSALSSVEPRNILDRAGFTALAQTMAGRSQGAHETREGVYATARAAAATLTDPAIMAWVCPLPDQHRLPVFDPAAFVRSRQTLYLLSKDGAGSAAPLVAALADRLMLEAVRAAERSPTARLDPPMLAVLDEAANICRISELPRLYSHLGSRGVIPLTILQSRSQGRRVWGEAGMDELFSAATIKIIGAGLDDPAFAEDISRLIGDQDVTVTTRTTGKSGGTSTTTRRERVLPADAVRALPKFTAILLATGIRPAALQLIPWMNGPHAAVVRRAHPPS